ncbi:MAG: CopG family transcriptional regulator [Candidatus Omnitrophica bacterium]|nr:CopG family transcriptional regulator [Candidatus Omnitrophota bacterium]
MSAEDFDRKFERGDVLEHLDIAHAKVIRKIQRVNIDFPMGLLFRLDKESERCGVSRSALIKMWLADRLEKVAT